MVYEELVSRVATSELSLRYNIIYLLILYLLYFSLYFTQVSPSELEVLLRAHPAIEDAAVVGVSDPQIGELPMAYVVSKNEDELTEMEIMQYVDENVAPHKRLRGGVDFISTIPKAVNGEILRAVQKKQVENAGTKRIVAME